MSSPEQNLTKTAAIIARGSPEAWARFIDAFTAYSIYMTSNCITSPIDTLPVAQGRAQIAAHLRDLLANAVAHADKNRE